MCLVLTFLSGDVSERVELLSCILILLIDGPKVNVGKSDVFIKVFKSLPKFKGDSKLSTWVYRIAYNTCLDKIRKVKKQRIHLDMEHADKIDYADLDTAFHKMVEIERSQLIEQCLSRLSGEDAGILTLFYLEEKNLLEMEKATSLPVNTLKVRLFRARKRLASIMEKSLNKEILQSNGSIG